jgi:hypothetical protein
MNRNILKKIINKISTQYLKHFSFMQIFTNTRYKRAERKY